MTEGDQKGNHRRPGRRRDALLALPVSGGDKGPVARDTDEAHQYLLRAAVDLQQVRSGEPGLFVEKEEAMPSPLGVFGQERAISTISGRQRKRTGGVMVPMPLATKTCVVGVRTRPCRYFSP